MQDEFIYQLFDDITSDTVRSVATFLRGLPDKARVILDITSYGGEIFPSIAIIQMIQMNQKFGVHFTARIWGLAASSAADIALACDRVEMGATGTIMIHSAWVVDVEENHKHDPGIEIANAAQLEVIHKRLPDYSEKDLQTDRWFTAGEALKIGLVDAIFDVDDSMMKAQIAAKYISIHNGEVTMEDVKKEEMIEEKAEEILEEKEEIREDEKPVLDDVLERIADRLEDIEKRLEKLEGVDEAQAACGDDERRENGRLKAVYDRISAICAPAFAKKAEKIDKKDDPKEGLEKHKAIYKNLDAYINKD